MTNILKLEVLNTRMLLALVYPMLKKIFGILVTLLLLCTPSLAEDEDQTRVNRRGFLARLAGTAGVIAAGPLAGGLTSQSVVFPTSRHFLAYLKVLQSRHAIQGGAVSYEALGRYATDLRNLSNAAPPEIRELVLQEANQIETLLRQMHLSSQTEMDLNFENRLDGELNTDVAKDIAKKISLENIGYSLVLIRTLLPIDLIRRMHFTISFAADPSEAFSESDFLLIQDYWLMLDGIKPFALEPHTVELLDQFLRPLVQLGFEAPSDGRMTPALCKQVFRD